MSRKKGLRTNPEVQKVVKKLVESGATVREITEELKRRFGKAYRRQDIQEDIRKYKGEKKKSDVEKYIPLKYRLKWIEKREEIFRKKYNHFFKFKTQDMFGEVYEKYIVVATNTRLSRSEIFKRAEHIIDNNEEMYEILERIIPGTLEYLYSVEGGRKK